MAVIYDISGSNSVDVDENGTLKTRVSGTVVTVNIGGVTGLTGSMKWEKQTTDLAISSSVYTTFWEKSETGAFYGAIFKLDDEDMAFRVELDGEVVIDCELKDDIKDEFKLNTGVGNRLEGPPFISMYTSKHYRFYPPEPLAFNSSIKLQLKAADNNKDLEAYLITWRSA